MAAVTALSLAVAACADQAPQAQPIEPDAALAAGICDRTPEIRTALLAAIDGAEHCAEVSDEHLGALDGTLDLSGLGIEGISPDDLSGLTRLRGLNLSGNQIHQIPTRLFARLPALCQVDVRDNPGAPFSYMLRLLETHADDLHSVAVDSDPAPPFSLNVLLSNEHVALSGAVVRISAGEQRSSLAQLGGVFGADEGQVWIADAAFAAGDECGQAFLHPGLEISVDRTELVVAAGQSIQGAEGAAEKNAVCAGIPTQVIVVGPHSFASDERIERLVTSRSGACFAAITIEPEPSSAPGGSCTVTEYVEAISGGTSQTGDLQGDCGWLRIEHSAGQGGAAGLEGCAVEELRLQVDAATFNRTGRADLVSFDQETRCYTFISAAQDPVRDEPLQFSPDQACSITTGAPLSGDCGSILIWSGVGRGGVNSEREARAEVARIRPAVEGEAEATHIGLIEACLGLPPLSIRLDADAFREAPAVHTYNADSDEQCHMALVVAPDPRVQSQIRVAGDRQCVVGAAFQLLGYPYLLPTTRTGDCSGLIHFAWYLPAGGQISEADFAALVKEAARDAGDSGAEGWFGSQAEMLCVNDVCALVWSQANQEAQP